MVTNVLSFKEKVKMIGKTAYCENYIFDYYISISIYLFVGGHFFQNIRQKICATRTAKGIKDPGSVV